MTHATEARPASRSDPRSRPRGFRRSGRQGPAAGRLFPTALLVLISVVLIPGCTRSGDAAHTSGEESPDVERSADRRIVLITGSTSGLGREVARRLARSGHHVIVHGRSEERGTSLVEEIEGETDGSARFYRADFASLDNVRELGEAVLRDYDRLDVLINNAGIWLEPSDGRLVSEEGHELHFQVNYLAHYLLTRILLPLLEDSGASGSPARIVNVASAAQRPIDFDDVMLDEGYSDGRGYAQSKLAQVIHTFALAETLEGTGVTVNAVHPASMMDTRMVLSRGARARSSVEEGAEAVLNLVESPDVGSGRYFNGTSPARAHDQAYDEASRARLMRLSEELTGG